MEEALQRQMLEVIKCRAEYNGLFEKLTLSNKLHHERERDHRIKVDELNVQISSLTSHNNELVKQNSEVSRENETIKRQFVHDAEQIAEVYAKLENKEKAMDNKLTKYKEEMANAAKALQARSNKIEQLEKEIAALRFQIVNEMVPLKQHKGKYPITVSYIIYIQYHIQSYT